tara:strand:- start:1570 stop:2103 length:534 start_codon:yes stop_codon:yes gene_type:complete
MILEKEFKFEIKKPIKFLKFKIDDNLVDTKYFINKIDFGCEENKNLSYKTNVQGKMTKFNFFLNDTKFINLVTTILNNKIFGDKNFKIVDAWGIKMKEGDFTQEHMHANNDYSAILYLNDVNNQIVFPEINLSIKPKKNMLLFFNGILKHYAESIKNELKYAIPFNINIINNWEKYE